MPKTTYNAYTAKWRELNIAWNVSEEEYTDMNSKSKTTFKCTIHLDEEDWESSLGVMNRGGIRCTQCKQAVPKKQKTKEDTNILLLAKGVERLKIIGKNSTRGKFRCLINPKHEWEEITQQLTIREKGCYMCYGKTGNSRVHKLYATDVLPKIKELGYTLLSEYEATDKIGEFQCSNGHTWKTHVGNVYRELSGCPECSKPSSEAISIFIMEQLTKKNFHKTRQVLPSGLELDGYNDELKLAIEYNGSQHYIYTPTLFHREEGSFEAQQNRDQKKKNECIELGIELITIHYKLNTFDKIREYIESKLLELEYDINKNLDWNELKKDFRTNYDNNRKQLDRIIEFAKSKNGICLSTNYISSNELMRFKCEVVDHPEFEKTTINARRSWCNECSRNAPQSTDRINRELVRLNSCLTISEFIGNTGDHQTFHCTEYDLDMEISWDNLKSALTSTTKSRCSCYYCDNSSKYGLAQSIPIYKYHLDDEFICKYDNIQHLMYTDPLWKNGYEAKNTSGIIRCCKEKAKSAYEYIWSFYPPVEGELWKDEDHLDKITIKRFKQIGIL